MLVTEMRYVMVNKITAQEMFDSLLKAVKVRGTGFRYVSPEDDACVYGTSDTDPSCGVGWALLDLAPEVYAKTWGVRASASHLMTNQDGVDFGLVEFTDGAISVAGAFQATQDMHESKVRDLGDNGVRKTWGQALADAYITLTLVGPE